MEYKIAKMDDYFRKETPNFVYLDKNRGKSVCCVEVPKRDLATLLGTESITTIFHFFIPGL